VQFNSSTVYSGNGTLLSNGSVTAELWRFNDDGLGYAIDLVQPAFTVRLPYTAFQGLQPSCAFNQAERLLYVQATAGFLNTAGVLHTIDVAQQRVVSSVDYPNQAVTCLTIAYSNQQQQLYAYISSADGYGRPVAVQAVNPLTGYNITVIDGSVLNVNGWNTAAWDDETGNWFLFDIQAFTYQLLSLTGNRTMGHVVVSGTIKNAPIDTVPWQAVYTNTNQPTHLKRAAKAALLDD